MKIWTLNLKVKISTLGFHSRSRQLESCSSRGPGGYWNFTGSPMDVSKFFDHWRRWGEAWWWGWTRGLLLIYRCFILCVFSWNYLICVISGLIHSNTWFDVRSALLIPSQFCFMGQKIYRLHSQLRSWIYSLPCQLQLLLKRRSTFILLCNTCPILPDMTFLPLHVVWIIS